MKQFIYYKMFLLIISSLMLANGIICAKESTSNSIPAENKKQFGLNQDIIFNSNITLKSAGYDINDIEDIKRAALIETSYKRLGALRLLADKMGNKSIPLLKKGLEDAEPRVKTYNSRLFRRL